MTRVPSAQLKAGAPDSPLSSVLSSLQETSLKAQTAYRRGEDLRREVGALEARVSGVEGQARGAANPDRMAYFVREVEALGKWKAQTTHRMGAIIELSNDAIAHAQEVGRQFEAISKQMSDAYIRQADELRRLAGEVADLRRRAAVRAAQ